MSGSLTGKRGPRFKKPTGAPPATKPKDIDQLMADGKEIDRAMEEAVHDALVAHMRAGVPVAVWEDGKVVLKPAEEFLTETTEKIGKSSRFRR